MSTRIKVALCQMDIAWLDIEANVSKIRRMALEAAGRGADMIVFPEMALTGFSMEPEKAAIDADDPRLGEIVRLSREFESLIIIGAAIRERKDGVLVGATNRSLLIQGGKLAGSYAKVNLFTYSGEHESYLPGDVPVLFNFKGHTFAPLVCYDLRFSELLLSMAESVTGAFIFIANWPDARADHWKTLLKARALDTQSYVIGVNRWGRGGSLNYAGDSAIVTPWGACLFEPMAGEKVEIVELDLAETDRFRQNFSVLEDRRALSAKLCSGALAPRTIVI